MTAPRRILAVLALVSLIVVLAVLLFGAPDSLLLIACFSLGGSVSLHFVEALNARDPR